MPVEYEGLLTHYRLQVSSTQYTIHNTQYAMRKRGLIMLKVLFLSFVHFP